MFSKKKVEDQFDKILNTDDIQQQIILLKKQVEFFKSQKPNFEYDYQNFLTLIEEFKNSKNYEYNIIWLQNINEIIRLNPKFKKKYFKQAMKIIFNNDCDSNNYKNKEEINIIKIYTISIFTSNCTEIFECDTYFQNLNRLKALVNLLIIDLFPKYFNKLNNKLLLLISNLFLNINKNKEQKDYLKNNYFTVMFNLLIELLCYLCLNTSFKIIDKKYKYDSMSEINFNKENDDDFKIKENTENETKKKYFNLINISNKLFNLYLNLNEQNKFDFIINYQILMKIFIIHCLESQYNESKCIEWFKLIYNNLKLNKILKMITESFDDEIFELFHISEDIINQIRDSNNLRILNSDKLLNMNIFFYLSENRSIEMELKNYYYNFISKFHKLRKKMIDNKEYIYNGLFILINLLSNEILSKDELKINFKEEFIIISLIKSLIKYMIKTNVIEMMEENQNNINNLINLLIDRFGSSLSEKIWKELLVLIKYFFSELIKNEVQNAIGQLAIILKKMIRLKIGGSYQFDENIFYNLINKICERKNNSCILNDYILFSVYFKNKYKTLNNNSYKYFIYLIKEKYDSYENNKNKNIDKDYFDKILELFTYYTLIYLNIYAKLEDKNLELFLLQYLNYLNFYFCLKKNHQSQYINLVINILNNTSDINYFKCVINYMIALHSSETSNILQKEPYKEKYLNLNKKLFIKLIDKLSISYQMAKLNYLFELIFNRLNGCINNDINYNFLRNILEILSHMSITKYNEILINSKKTDLISNNYFSIGKTRYSSLLVGNKNKNNFKKIGEQWCVIDLKEIFDILIKILRKKNINIEYKEKIINFIKIKINDIFFFNKINIESFIDYIINLDKDDLKEFNLYLDRKEMILSINDILKSLAYLMLYNKNLFIINNYDKLYEKLIYYAFDKINYFKKIICIITNKYNIKIIKNKGIKNLTSMKNLLGIDKEGMPNILNLSLDSNDFIFNNKDKDKDINYQIFMNEEIQIDKFICPNKNLREILIHFKSYLDILEISLHSLIYIHNKNINYNISFIRQIENNIDIDLSEKENNIDIKDNDNENFNHKKNENISEEIKNKYRIICEKLFKIMNKFPDIIKYQNNIIYDIYKLFLYCKDFIIFCGEKYIIQTILILFSISFPEFYQKIFETINNEFKNICNEGKDFIFQKIETIKQHNDNNKKRINSSINIHYSSTKISNNDDNRNNSEENYINLRDTIEGFVDVNYKSVVDLQNEREKNFDRTKSSDYGLNLEFKAYNNAYNNNYYKDNKNNDNTNIKIEQKIENKIFLIRKLIIEYLIKSKYSLKIFNIINYTIKEINNNDYKDKEEGIILFLLLCKWRIVNEENVSRNENINIFKNRYKIKNYFNKDLFDISIENINMKKTIAIKSPISSNNFIINNNYKNIQSKNTLNILAQNLIQDNKKKKVENILSRKLLLENKKIYNITKRSQPKSDRNTFCFKSSSNVVLNEIKELEEEDRDNFSGSDNEKNNDENDSDNYINEEDNDNTNIEELISAMYSKPKNNLFKLYENDLNKNAIRFNTIDKTLLYNELDIYITYIINHPNKDYSLSNFQTSSFYKFLKKLTLKDEETNMIYNRMKLSEQKEFIFSDNLNMIKYIINNDSTNNNNNSNSPIYLIFNNTLQNKKNKNNVLIRNNIDIDSDYVYLYIFIIPLSEEFWKIEFKINQKKNDEFSRKIKNMIEMNFLNCYFFSIKNNFGYILYHFKILFSLLQDLICNLKQDFSYKKITNKLNGIKHEEMIERMNIFKSINSFLN